MQDRFAEVKASVSLEEFADAHLQRLGDGKLVCPACGSGTGRNHTAAFNIDPKKPDTWTCFACDRHGDVFDLAGAVLGIDGKAEQLQAVAQWAGIDIGTGSASPQDRAQAPKADGQARIAAEEQERRLRASREAEERRVEEFAEGFASHPEAVSYWRSRGFTVEEARSFGVGYDADHKRIVLPWVADRYYHIDRSVCGADPKYTKPKAEGVGSQPAMFNPSVLEKPAFVVVEGVLDALAVMACGYSAESLAGVGFEKLVTRLKEERYKGVVIEALDCDKRGEESGAHLIDALSRAGIACIEATPYPEYVAEVSDSNPSQFITAHPKDAAETLERDRGALVQWLAENFEAANAEADRIKREEYSEALERLHVYNSYAVLDSIVSGSAARPSVPTGIKALDRALHGGLHPGLTVLGAGSSIGKTTLLTQLADSIAASKRPVLFVSIEQSGEELVVKSLCRIAYRSSGLCLFGQSDVLDSTARASWGDGGKAAALASAAEEYRSTIAPWLLYMGADGRPSVSDVRAAADRIADRCGCPPVAFIDYVQLLKPHDDRASDKQVLDYHITALRQLARDMQTPVVCVSSISRAAYFASIGMDSFKESGSVEYSADFALGLQPAGLADAIKNRAKGVKPEDAAEQFIEDNKREAAPMREVVVIKLRGYRLPPDPVTLRFNGAAQCFEDAAQDRATPPRVI